VGNTQRITAVAFLSYFVLSGMLAPIGIVSAPMAQQYARPVTEITAQFSWLTGGNFVGAIVALFVFDWIALRRMFIVVYGVIAAGLLSLSIIHSLDYARGVLAVAGFGSGIGLAGAALTISRTYAGERRASFLVITDGCFSVAGFVCASLASALLGLKFGWSVVYQCIGLAALAIVALSALSRFPTTTRSEAGGGAVAEPWTPPIWICAAALFLYTLGQYSMVFWLPNYAGASLGATPEEAGALVGRFWLGMFLAQILVAWLVLRVGVRRLAPIAAIMTAAGSIPLWLVRDPAWLSYCTLAWGVANLSMLKMLLSFATTMVRTPDARLVSGLLLGATLGTGLSPAISSAIVAASDVRIVMICATGAHVVMMALVLIARRRHPIASAAEEASRIHAA
jgi:TsgA-like MFS transporter